MLGRYLVNKLGAWLVGWHNSTGDTVVYPVKGVIETKRPVFPLEYNKNISYGRIKPEDRHYNRKMQQRVEPLNEWFKHINREIELLSSNYLVDEAKQLIDS